jgi:hypothetical protein
MTWAVKEEGKKQLSETDTITGGYYLMEMRSRKFFFS